MDSSMPGLPVHHQLLELAQTHVHRVGDAIQPSHPLSSPSPPAPNPSQHQGLFQCVGSSHQVAKVKNIKLIFSKRVNPKGSLIHLISHNFKYIKENILDTLCPRHPVTPLRSLGGMKLPLPPKVIKVGTLGCQEGHCPEGNDLHPLARSPPQSVSLCLVIIGKKSSHPSAPRFECCVTERRPRGPGHQPCSLSRFRWDLQHVLTLGGCNHSCCEVT